MAVKCLAVGRNMPDWVNQAFLEYNKRLPPEFSIDLLEIRPEHRSESSQSRHRDQKKPNQTMSALQLQIVEKEGNKLLDAIPPQHTVIALDERGQSWTTLQLAEQLKTWREDQQKICLMIGGPDGLSDACRQRAQKIWSLSPLTLPHPLVRVIIAEQIYRAWSILTNHPYHRG